MKIRHLAAILIPFAMVSAARVGASRRPGGFSAGIPKSSECACAGRAPAHKGRAGDCRRARRIGWSAAI